MREATRKFLHDIVAEILGLSKDKVIWRNQDGPKLAKPFAVLAAYSMRGEAMEEIRKTNTNGITDIVTPTAAVLEVQLFDKKSGIPTDKLEYLVRRLESPSIVDKCFAAGVAFFDSEPVQDITGLLSNGQQYEPRAAVDLRFRYTYGLEDDTSYIDEVNGILTNDESGGGNTSPGGDKTDGNGAGMLIYGNISPDGTVSDYAGALNVDFSAKGN